MNWKLWKKKPQVVKGIDGPYVTYRFDLGALRPGESKSFSVPIDRKALEAAAKEERENYG